MFFWQSLDYYSWEITFLTGFLKIEVWLVYNVQFQVYSKVIQFYIFMCMYIHTYMYMYMCVYIYTYIIFQIIFHFRILKDIE